MKLLKSLTPPLALAAGVVLVIALATVITLAPYNVNTPPLYAQQTATSTDESAGPADYTPPVLSVETVYLDSSIHPRLRFTWTSLRTDLVTNRVFYSHYDESVGEYTVAGAPQPYHFEQPYDIAESYFWGQFNESYDLVLGFTLVGDTSRTVYYSTPVPLQPPGELIDLAVTREVSDLTGLPILNFSWTGARSYLLSNGTLYSRPVGSTEEYAEHIAAADTDPSDQFFSFSEAGFWREHDAPVEVVLGFVMNGRPTVHYSNPIVMYPPGYVLSAPARPSGLSATASYDSVTLTWDDPGDDSIAGYVILRRIPGDDPEGQFRELVSDTGSAATTYTDNTVEAETRYTYRIKAINGAGTSERSRWFHIDIPAGPPVLSLEEIGDKIRFSWTSDTPEFNTDDSTIGIYSRPLGSDGDYILHWGGSGPVNAPGPHEFLVGIYVLNGGVSKQPMEVVVGFTLNSDTLNGVFYSTPVEFYPTIGPQTLSVERGSESTLIFSWTSSYAEAGQGNLVDLVSNGILYGRPAGTEQEYVERIRVSGDLPYVVSETTFWQEYDGENMEVALGLTVNGDPTQTIHYTEPVTLVAVPELSVERYLDTSTDEFWYRFTWTGRDDLSYNGNFYVSSVGSEAPRRITINYDGPGGALELNFSEALLLELFANNDFTGPVEVVVGFRTANGPNNVIYSTPVVLAPPPALSLERTGNKFRLSWTSDEPRFNTTDATVAIYSRPLGSNGDYILHWSSGAPPNSPSPLEFLVGIHILNSASVHGVSKQPMEIVVEFTLNSGTLNGVFYSTPVEFYPTIGPQALNVERGNDATTGDATLIFSWTSSYVEAGQGDQVDLVSNGILYAHPLGTDQEYVERIRVSGDLPYVVSETTVWQGYDGENMEVALGLTVNGDPTQTIHYTEPVTLSAPARPSGLSATASSYDSVTLTWDDPADNSIAGYVILRRVRENDVGGEFDVLVADTGSAATTYTDNTVEAGTIYTYRIKAINAFGTSERSHWFHIDIPRPPALSLEEIGDDIRFSWTSDAPEFNTNDSSTFNVYSRIIGSEDDYILHRSGSGTNITGLREFEVNGFVFNSTQIHGARKAPMEIVVEFTLNSGTLNGVFYSTPVEFYPTIGPQTLSVERGSESTLIFSWTSSYVEAGQGAEVPLVSNGILYVRPAGTDQEYAERIRVSGDLPYVVSETAFWQEYDGENMEVALGLTVNGDPTQTIHYTEPVTLSVPEPPARPSGLSATASSYDSVILTWDDPDDDSITGYVILRRIPGDDPEGHFDVLVANTETAATTYTDDTVSAETRYTYRIRAINGGGTSERSLWFHIDIPGPPALSLEEIGDDIRFSWTADAPEFNTNDSSTFNVYSRIIGSEDDYILHMSGSGTNITGLREFEVNGFVFNSTQIHGARKAPMEIVVEFTLNSGTLNGVFYSTPVEFYPTIGPQTLSVERGSESTLIFSWTSSYVEAGQGDQVDLVSNGILYVRPAGTDQEYVERIRVSGDLPYVVSETTFWQEYDGENMEVALGLTVNGDPTQTIHYTEPVTLVAVPELSVESYLDTSTDVIWPDWYRFTWTTDQENLADLTYTGNWHARPAGSQERYHSISGPPPRIGDSEEVSPVGPLWDMFFAHRFNGSVEVVFIFQVGGPFPFNFIYSTPVVLDPLPDKPRGLEATVTHGQVTLTWDDPGDDTITGYVILRRIPGVDPEGHFDVLVADTGSAATTYTDDTVSAETRYTYRIKAINGTGTSERSRWYHIDIPAAP